MAKTYNPSTQKGSRPEVAFRPVAFLSRQRYRGDAPALSEPRGREAQEAGLTAIATKCVPSPLLTRNRTALRLSFFASASAAATSAGLLTARPPAYKITSPTCIPF